MKAFTFAALKACCLACIFVFNRRTAVVFVWRLHVLLVPAWATLCPKDNVYIQL